MKESARLYYILDCDTTVDTLVSSSMVATLSGRVHHD